jgi:CRP/FNR family transcriptional regulator, cyclic AMP receptor protein
MPTDPKYLQEFSCFRNLTEKQVEAIAEITNAVCYSAGYTLFEEDKPGDRLFFLVKGRVEVFYNIGEFGPTRVDQVSGEEVVGCSALVKPYVYSATERTVSEVEVLEVDVNALRELMQKDHDLAYTIHQHILGVLMKRILDLRLATPGS